MAAEIKVQRMVILERAKSLKGWVGDSWGTIKGEYEQRSMC